MQCERCGIQFGATNAQATSIQCEQCGHVNTRASGDNSGQPVYILDPDDSDIFNVDDKTRVDKPALRTDVPVGRVATKQQQPSLGDMLFLDSEPKPIASADIPQENHNFTSHSDIYHYDAVTRLDALKLPGAESTAPHRLPPSAVDTAAPTAARIPKPNRNQELLLPPEPPKATVTGALFGATLTILVLVILGLGLFRMTLGLTPPTTELGLEQFSAALKGGELALAQTDGVIISSYRSITYPTGSSNPVLLIFGEVENHRDVDVENMLVRAELIDELGVVIADHTIPIGLKFTPPELAGLQDIHKLSEMVAIKSQQADSTITARSSRSWSMAIPAPLTNIEKLEHRISLLQKETPKN